jgi:hypothetical protein
MSIRKSCLLLCCVASPCAAQTVNSAMVWIAAFGDQHVADRTAFSWDVQARRAHAGETWQLLLGTLGVTRELSPHWKTTAALGWSHGYRYGAFPARSNSFELRPLIQVTGSRAVGSWTWSDRVRVEFRVIRPIGELAPADPEWAKTVVRVRRQDKFQHKLTTNGAWYGALSQELLMNVAPATARVAMLEQLRWQTVLGHQISPHNRVEVGYGLQRINRRGGYEMNHTLLMYLRTSVPFR